jgi:leucyl/phenylalanyl-tRNA--protein transferase
MSSGRAPSRQEFDFFFYSRLQELAPDDELIWVSNTVPVDALATAYPLGIFPWPGEDPKLFPWVCPSTRGVLPLTNFRLGRSTQRALNRADFRVTRNTAFSQIIEACHSSHEPESWIHPLMRESYTQAHQLGFAHSIEVWNGEDLVGGLYGIDSGHFFSGESMFHREPNAGKAAIAFLVNELQERGDTLLDIQQLTPHMQAMGAEEWTRVQFLNAILPTA